MIIDMGRVIIAHPTLQLTEQILDAREAGGHGCRTLPPTCKAKLLGRIGNRIVFATDSVIDEIVSSIRCELPSDALLVKINNRQFESL